MFFHPFCYKLLHIFEGMQRYSSMADLTLRRPKDYIRPLSTRQTSAESVDRVAELGPPPILRRPKEYQDQQQYYGYHSPLAVVTTPTYYAGDSQAGISVF